jgi:hypothetical protein
MNTVVMKGVVMKGDSQRESYALMFEESNESSMFMKSILFLFLHAS